MLFHSYLLPVPERELGASCCTWLQKEGERGGSCPPPPSSASTIYNHSRSGLSGIICDVCAAKTIQIILYLLHFIGEEVEWSKHTSKAYVLFFLLLAQAPKNSPRWALHLDGRQGKKSRESPGSHWLPLLWEPADQGALSYDYKEWK